MRRSSLMKKLGVRTLVELLRLMIAHEVVSESRGDARLSARRRATIGSSPSDRCDDERDGRQARAENAPKSSHAGAPQGRTRSTPTIRGRVGGVVHGT